MRSCALRTLRPAIPSPLPKSTPPSSKHSAALPNITRSLRSATISRSSAPRALLPSSQTLAAINFSRRGTRSASSSSSSSNASMRRSRQAFSAPSKQTSDLNPKGDLNSIASISVSSTISTPWSEPSASKPRDLSLEREQNSRYRHDNGLTIRTKLGHKIKDLIYRLYYRIAPLNTNLYLQFRLKGALQTLEDFITGAFVIDYC